MIVFENLIVGKWYLPLFERLDAESNEIDFTKKYNCNSPFFKYLGDREFEDESGELVNGFYEPELGLMVAVDAPDGFLES